MHMESIWSRTLVEPSPVVFDCSTSFRLLHWFPSRWHLHVLWHCLPNVYVVETLGEHVTVTILTREKISEMHMLRDHGNLTYVTYVTAMQRLYYGGGPRRFAPGQARQASLRHFG